MSVLRIIYDSHSCWYINGQLHREDGPAIEWNHGSKEWWVDGKRHREDGPAIEGQFSNWWFLDGKQYTEDNWLKEICSRNNSKIVEVNGKKYKLTEV